ncbi:MAG: ABC transporter substrate-binding protein [Symbiobacteriaceae bacterium]|nr:ABC transporter substrate-binding protein [Symbiobacteriaceae bacterium]
MLLTACQNSLLTPSEQPVITPAATPVAPPATLSYTDALGLTQKLPLTPQRVVSIFGSFAELWELAGGTLVGVTQDAIEENRLHNSPDATVIGTNKAPSSELLLALEPDLVILSADIPQQQELGELLQTGGIPHFYLKVESFEDYLGALDICTQLTTHRELYDRHGTTVAAEIDELRQDIATWEEQHPLVLLIRAMSTTAKGKGADINSGLMIQEMGGEHLVSRYPSLLEELSIEIILQDDPAYIFVITMGDEEAALQALSQIMLTHPAWRELTAIKEERCYLLPKHLFHFKPNAAWGEAYAFLAEILYPGVRPHFRPLVEASILKQDRP